MHPMHPLNPRALIGIAAVLGILAVAGLLASQPGWANLAHAQDSPSVAIELSGDSVEPGTAITVTMTFGGLAFDSDKATRDYIFRADVKDSENEDADGCEDRKNGYGLGVERYMWMVDQDPEVRRGATSAGCPAGDYTVRAMIASPNNVELAWASASFSVVEPEPPPSDDATLSSLALSGIDFGAFDPATTGYTAEVANEVTETTVTPAVNHDGAAYAIKLDGVADADGTLGLAVGDNTVSVEVTAEDGETKKTYEVAVTRAAPALSGDATLSGLTLSGIDFGAFDPAVTGYTAEVANDVTETTVTPSTNHDGATHVVKLDGVADADATIDLAVGENAVTIEVTAEDGQTAKTYTVTVTRAAPPASNDATLSGLALSGIDFGAFDPAITEYAAEAANDVTETTVTPATNHDGATYVVKLDGVADADGTVALAVGENAVTIEVTAEDGQTAKTYTVTVTRAAPPLSGDATLSGLALSGITLAFDPAITAYTAEVANDVTETTVTPATNHDGATYAIKLDGVADADGTVDLAVGENAVGVEVTAEDGETAKTYTVTVTRADAPPDDTPAGPAALVGIALPSEMTEGEASKVNLAFFGLEPDSDRATQDYVFRADVKNSENEDASVCEGKGMGRDRPVWMVDQDPESRAVVISADCPAGDYTLRVSIRRPNYVRVASDRVGFTIEAPAQVSGPDTARAAEESTGTAGSSITVLVETITNGKRVTVSWTDGGTCATTSSYNAYLHSTAADLTVAYGITATPVAGTSSYSKSKESTTFVADEMQLWCGTNDSGRLVAKVAGLNEGAAGTYTHSVPGVATLGGLSLSHGTLRPAFDIDTTEYRAAVANGVAQVTVLPAATDNGATVSYLDGSDAALADADDNTGGHQVAAAVGLTTFKVKVTASDTVTTQTYTVVVERDSADPYGWTPTRDLNGLTAAGNGDGYGTWSDGTTMWVVDRIDAKLYAYTLSGGARDTAEEFDLHTDNDDPTGIWSDGTTIWVDDAIDGKLYAYALSGGTRNTDKEFALDSANGNPTDIWSDETTVWVADITDDKLYAYTLDGGARDSAKEFSLHTDNGSPDGLWSDGTTIWAADFDDDKLYAYALSGGARQAGKDFTTLAGTGGFGVIAAPRGIWSDGTTMWVLEREPTIKGGKIYSFNMPPPASDDATLSGLTLSNGTLRPEFAADTTEYRAAVANGVSQVTVTPAVNDANATVAYLDGSDAALADADDNTGGHQVAAAVGATTFKVKVTAADTTTTKTYTVVIERDSADDFGWTPTRDLNGLNAAGNTAGYSIWSDGTTVWVADLVDDKLYAYTLANGARDSGNDITLHTDNGSARGIWSNGTTIWVADQTDDKLYAYALSDGTRDMDKEFALDATNGKATGVWSNGTTIWVADQTDSKLYAYALSDGTRDMDKEFTLDATNGKATGVWSNGTTMWVADSIGDKLYAYALSDGTRQAGKEFGTLAGTGGFDGLTVGPAGIWSDGTTMWAVRIDLVDTDSSKIYSFNMPPSTDATLLGLILSPGTLRPGFDSDETEYRAAVANGVAQVTVISPANDFDATVTYLDGSDAALADADTGADWHQVDAAVGLTTFKVKVTAADTTTTKTYTVVVERDSDDDYGWTPTRDLNGLTAAGNRNGYGIWTDGTTIWVADNDDDKLFAYKQSTGARDSDKDIELDSANANPTGVWSNGDHHLGGRQRRQQALRLRPERRNPRHRQGIRPGLRQRQSPKRLVRRDHHLGVGLRRRQALRLRAERWNPRHRQGIHPARQPPHPAGHLVRRDHHLGGELSRRRALRLRPGRRGAPGRQGLQHPGRHRRVRRHRKRPYGHRVRRDHHVGARNRYHQRGQQDLLLQHAAAGGVRRRHAERAVPERRHVAARVRRRRDGVPGRGGQRRCPDHRHPHRHRRRRDGDLPGRQRRSIGRRRYRRPRPPGGRGGGCDHLQGEGNGGGRQHRRDLHRGHRAGLRRSLRLDAHPGLQRRGWNRQRIRNLDRRDHHVGREHRRHPYLRLHRGRQRLGP